MKPATLIFLGLMVLLPPAGMSFGPFECREKLFFSEEELAELRAEEDFWVVVRVLGACNTARQIKLVRHRTHNVAGELLRPFKRSVDEQLEHLANRFPEAKPEELCGLVKLENVAIDEGKASALTALMDELEKLHLSPVFEPVIHLHGVGYRIWVGSSIHLSYFEFEGPPFRRGSRNEAVNPLEAWGQKLLNVVEADCEITGESVGEHSLLRSAPRNSRKKGLRQNLWVE